MFSKACEYGIRAAIFIAEQTLLGNKVEQKIIAEAINSPVSFTAKTLQILTRTHLISADKGRNGGFYFSEAQLNTTMLSDIVTAIDSNNIYKGCGLGLKQCNAQKPCPLHYKFKIVRDELTTMLETTSVQDLAIGLKSGSTFLKR